MGQLELAVLAHAEAVRLKQEDAHFRKTLIHSVQSIPEIGGMFLLIKIALFIPKLKCTGKTFLKPYNVQHILRPFTLNSTNCTNGNVAADNSSSNSEMMAAAAAAIFFCSLLLVTHF